jgi:hypothetical protein
MRQNLTFHSGLVLVIYILSELTSCAIWLQKKLPELFNIVQKTLNRVIWSLRCRAPIRGRVICSWIPGRVISCSWAPRISCPWSTSPFRSPWWASIIITITPTESLIGVTSVKEPTVIEFAETSVRKVSTYLLWTTAATSATSCEVLLRRSWRSHTICHSWGLRCDICWLELRGSLLIIRLRIKHCRWIDVVILRFIQLLTIWTDWRNIVRTGYHGWLLICLTLLIIWQGLIPSSTSFGWRIRHRRKVGDDSWITGIF